MPEYRSEPIISPCNSGLLPEGECSRRAALTSFSSYGARAKVPGKEVICYECGRKSHVPAAALSSNCIHCQAHLRMTDVDLKPNSQRLTVRTLGNVTVLPDAVLSQLSIVCNNLTLYGKGNGSFRCSGELRICNSTQVDGSVQVKHLRVERGVSISFTRGVVADTADIYGKVTGRVEATGKVKIHRGGELHGVCRTPSLVLKPGAVHQGEWVQRSSPADEA